ncbi:MAG TPA: nucleotide exchange factor GrpE [Polyangiaceae bacterium]
MVTDPAESDDMPNSSNRTPESAEEERGVATEDLGEAPSDVMEAAAAADPLAESRAESQRFKDQWMRTAADFDNFRKRARREVDDARKAGREELLRELLPVFDNLERALASAQRASDIKGVAEGLGMVMKQFESTLGRVHISKVPTVGHPFDPSIHEAIQQVETDEHPAGQVVAEVQPGYIQGEKLVRAALVVVAKPGAGKAPAQNSDPQS